MPSRHLGSIKKKSHIFASPSCHCRVRRPCQNPELYTPDRIALLASLSFGQAPYPLQQAIIRISIVRASLGGSGVWFNGGSWSSHPLLSFSNRDTLSLPIIGVIIILEKWVLHSVSRRCRRTSLGRRTISTGWRGGSTSRSICIISGFSLTDRANLLRQ